MSELFALPGHYNYIEQQKPKMFANKKIDKNKTKFVKHDFNKYVSRYYSKLYRSSFYQTGNHEDAQDLVQETFLAAYRSFQNFRGDSSFITWLYGIFRNLLKKHRQRQRIFINKFGSFQQNTANNLVSPDSPETDAEYGEEKYLINNAISELPDKYSEILILRHFENFSYEEIASILNINTGTVKSRIHKARKLLYDKLR